MLYSLLFLSLFWPFSFIRDGQCPEYTGDEQAICAVGLVKAKPGIFVEAIQYLLVLATPVEVLSFSLLFCFIVLSSYYVLAMTRVHCFCAFTFLPMVVLCLILVNIIGFWMYNLPIKT